MRRLIFTFLFSVLSAAVYGTSNQADTILYKWIPSGVAGLNVSQIAFTKWAQGGENNITWSITGNFGLKYKTINYALRNDLKVAYGRTKIGSQDFRTNNNELYLETVFAYIIGWEVDPYVSNTVRTNVAAGYNYTDTSAIRISDFFDPGYVTQSVGFSYDKLTNFRTRLGIAFQETFTSKFRQYSDDPETTPEVEAFKFETGIESVSTAQFTIDDNLLFDSKLRLFTRFDKPDVWDVRWDNTITAQINKYINVNFNVLLLYEKSQSPYTQLKQALLLGFTYTFF